MGKITTVLTSSMGHSRGILAFSLFSAHLKLQSVTLQTLTNYGSNYLSIHLVSGASKGKEKSSPSTLEESLPEGTVMCS